jgi:uncharacterized phage-associated protein
MKRTNSFKEEIFKERVETTIHAILYVIHTVGGKCDFHKIFKIFYFADQKHMNKWGKPILFDDYIAMKDGPVPSIAYDILKSLKGSYSMYLKALDIDFHQYFEFVEPYHIKALAAPDMDYLSESEIECLNKSIKENKNLSFGQLSKKSHDSAWEKAGKNNNMDIIEIAKSANVEKEFIPFIKERFALNRY